MIQRIREGFSRIYSRKANAHATLVEGRDVSLQLQRKCLHDFNYCPLRPSQGTCVLGLFVGLGHFHYASLHSKPVPRGEEHALAHGRRRVLTGANLTKSIAILQLHRPGKPDLRQEQELDLTVIVSLARDSSSCLPFFVFLCPRPETESSCRARL